MRVEIFTLQLAGRALALLTELKVSIEKKNFFYLPNVLIKMQSQILTQILLHFVITEVLHYLCK